MVSTGIKGLDTIIHDLRLGDNVVWQVDDVKSYLHFVQPYIKHALKTGRNLIYIRFAKHQLLVDDPRARTYQIDASKGFESFSKEIHEVITKEGLIIPVSVSASVLTLSGRRMALGLFRDIRVHGRYL